MTLRVAFTFRNQGGAAATGVRARFNLPEGLNYLVGSGKVDGAELDDEHGNTPLLTRTGAEIGEVAPGEERAIEIAYSVAGTIENGTIVELQAAVAAFELPPIGSNIVRLVVRSRPELEDPQTRATIEARPGALAGPTAGSEATITVRVHNSGASSAHDVMVVAPVPEWTAYVANSARVNGRELERELLASFDKVHAPIVAPTLPAGATATLQYRVRLDDPLPERVTITAHATIASQETPSFEVPPATLEVQAWPNFENEQTELRIQPEAELRAGDELTVTLRLHNSGKAAAEKVNAALDFGAGLLPVRGSVQIDGEPLRVAKKESGSYDLGRIPARSSLELRCAALAASPATQEETAIGAHVRWHGGERSFERTIALRAAPNFSRRTAVERLGAATVHPSDECQASIVLSNDGSAPATDALLRLEVDSLFDDVQLYEGDAKLTLQAGAAEIGIIEAYSARAFTARMRVRTPCADRSQLRVRVMLHAQELGERAVGEVFWRVESRAAFSAQSSGLQLIADDVFRPNQMADVYVRLRNDGTDVAQNVRMLLYVSPEARLESIEGATRDRSTLLFGDLRPGAGAEARLGVRLLRSLAKAHPVTIEPIVMADNLLPVQLEPLSIVTTAEPNFAVGTLYSDPGDAADAGQEVVYALHVRNGGDGPARRVSIRVDQIADLIYVPNSTSVNGLPVRDTGAVSALAGERGIVLMDVDPGIEAAISWREVVRHEAAAGAAITRVARISYDGDRIDEIAAKELRVRSTPAFGNATAALPFGVDGMLGPSLGAGARALPGTEGIMELPAATPVGGAKVAIPRAIALSASGNGRTTGEDAEAHGIAQTALGLGGGRLEHALRLLQEARYGGVVDHLFAIRAFFPDAAGAREIAPFAELVQSLRERLDRLFIKLRLPSYVLQSRDIETPAARSALQSLAMQLAPGEPAMEADSLHGALEVGELRALGAQLENAPLGSALPWGMLARFLPMDPPLRRYRELLIGSLDDLANAPAEAFVEILRKSRYAVLDEALFAACEQLYARAE